MTPDYQAVIESAWRLGGKEAAEETFLRLLQEKALLWCSYRIPANSVGSSSFTSAPKLNIALVEVQDAERAFQLEQQIAQAVAWAQSKRKA